MGDISPELALLRECHDRAMEREGIPMVLALVSEVEPIPPVSDAGTLADGGRLAQSMDRVRSALAPSGRDDDMGHVITVLQATSYADFGQSEARL